MNATEKNAVKILLKALGNGTTWPVYQKKVVHTKTIKPAKAPKLASVKKAPATLDQAKALVGHTVKFESGFYPRTGELETIVMGHYEMSWADGVKSWIFHGGDKGNAYLVLKGDEKRYRIEKVYGLVAA